MGRENAVTVGNFDLDFDTEKVVIQNDQDVVMPVARPVVSRPYYRDRDKHFKNKAPIKNEVPLEDEPVNFGIFSFFKALSEAYLNNIDKFMSPAVFVTKLFFNNFIIVSKFLIAILSGIALTVISMNFVPSIKSLFLNSQQFIVEYWFYASMFFIANMFLIFNILVVYRIIAFTIKSLYVAVIKQSSVN